MEMIESIDRKNTGHYTAGIISNGMLFISGQLAIDPYTREVNKGGIEEHTNLALKNVESILVEAGLSRRDIVLCRLYITDIDEWEKVDRVYSDFFGNHKPARIVLPVGKLHYGSFIEIEAIAEVNQR